MHKLLQFPGNLRLTASSSRLRRVPRFVREIPAGIDGVGNHVFELIVFHVAHHLVAVFVPQQAQSARLRLVWIGMVRTCSCGRRFTQVLIMCASFFRESAATHSIE